MTARIISLRNAPVRFTTRCSSCLVTISPGLTFDELDERFGGLFGLDDQVNRIASAVCEDCQPAHETIVRHFGEIAIDCRAVGEALAIARTSTAEMLDNLPELDDMWRYVLGEVWPDELLVREFATRTGAKRLTNPLPLTREEHLAALPKEQLDALPNATVHPIGRTR